ncbi:unnamed protein product [Gongylonema pulchrum]|uniref:RRM domain-containing protein n=1 Tax=Gongylonema pulchrum TaxID=637853 RepID=A0A183EJS2_9BILA|nr:unnamed protein product [Gongylonema pulchrum]
MVSRYVEVFRSSAEEMEHSFYASRGIPPPSSGPVPLRGLSPSLEFRFRERYGGEYPGRFGGPMRLSSVHLRPSPYERPFMDRERYLRYGGRYEPEFEDTMYDPAKVFMRGLPYSVTTLDIEEFFRPLNCVEIKLGYNEERRLSGDALVTFSTMAEAREALTRNKKNMGTRYIELFPGTSIPHPIKTVAFRTVSGAPTRLAAAAPRPLYSSFADGNTLLKVCNNAPHFDHFRRHFENFY